MKNRNGRVRVITLLVLYLSGIAALSAADKAVVLPDLGNDFLVIPLPAEDFCPEGDNIVRVEKSGGDFSSIALAMASILDAASDKIYTLCIGPGTYDLKFTLAMKPWVNIVGSGIGTTTVSGPQNSWSLATSAVVEGADNASISGLKIHATGGLASSVGIYNDYASPVIEDLEILSDGEDINYGIYNEMSSPELNRVSITSTGGDIHYAVYNEDSAPTLNEVTAVATGGDINYAVYNSNSAPDINDSSIDGSSKDGSALVSADASAAVVDGSVLIGSVVAEDTSTNLCTDTVNGGGTPLAADCQLP